MKLVSRDLDRGWRCGSSRGRDWCYECTSRYVLGAAIDSGDGSLHGRQCVQGCRNPTHENVVLVGAFAPFLKSLKRARQRFTEPHKDKFVSRTPSLEILQYPLGVGSVVTRILECGNGDDHIVFIHGLGARADRWRLTLPTFAAAGYHGYAFDLPGHGLATKGVGIPLGVPSFAEFSTAALDELGIKRAFLVGTSLGAHVAATVACAAPDRVRGLILVGAVGIVPLGAEAADAIRRNVQQTTRDAIAGKLAFVLANPRTLSPTMIEEEWRVNNSPGARESFEKLGDYIAEDVDHDSVGERLSARIADLPMLLVWGAKDKAVSLEIGERARDLLLGTELVVIDDAGHVPYFEQPDAFNKAVLARLEVWRSAAR